MESKKNAGITVNQIQMRMHLRAGAMGNDFKAGLPPLESDMTAQAFKDPYIYDFLGTTEARGKAELKLKLVDHVQKFLLDLGRGFALVGRDVVMEVGDTDFTMDLLFYHLKLRSPLLKKLKLNFRGRPMSSSRHLPGKICYLCVRVRIRGLIMVMNSPIE
jgi:predicted nuclease of restriction endonuclease-like (RecB) superfamily